MLRLLLPPVMRIAHFVRRVGWAVYGPSPGVNGVVLARDGRIVLVRLTYAEGWHLPGGGRKRHEAPEEGLLRELREEIGLQAWGALEAVPDEGDPAAARASRNALYVVRDAAWRPHWSIEIAEVRAFHPDALPAGLTPWTRAALRRAGL